MRYFVSGGLSNFVSIKVQKRKVLYFGVLEAINQLFFFHTLFLFQSYGQKTPPGLGTKLISVSFPILSGISVKF